MKKTFLVILCVVGFLGLGGGVYAQDAPFLTLSPSIIEVETEPLGVVNRSITVQNTSDISIPIKIDASDYAIDASGVPSYLSNGLEWTPTDWITIEPATLILEPNGSREISISISVPENALAGSHFAAIIFKPVMPPEYFDTQSTHIIPYIGAIVGISVDTEEIEPAKDFLVVEEFNHTIPEDNSEVLFNTTLRNEDAYYHKVEGDITVTNLLENVVVEEEVKGVTLFPDSSREIMSTYASRLPFGRYTATLNIEGEGDEASEAVTFWVEPTIMEVVIMIAILFGSVLAIALLILLIMKRKNVIKAVRTLIKK